MLKQKTVNEMRRLAFHNETEELCGQFGMVTEEMGELLQAHNKLLRGKGSTDHVKEEALDVVTTILCYLSLPPYNMTAKQMMDELDEHAKAKVERAFQRIKEGGLA